MYLGELLEMNMVELAQLGFEQAVLHQAYIEGRMLAEWAQQNPRKQHGTS